MWPFRKSKTRIPELSNLAYSRWLRAVRPPFEWFLSLTEDEQETLACLGEDHLLETRNLVEHTEQEETTNKGVSPRDLAESIAEFVKSSKKPVTENTFQNTFLGKPADGAQR